MGDDRRAFGHDVRVARARRRTGLLPLWVGARPPDATMEATAIQELTSRRDLGLRIVLLGDEALEHFDPASLAQLGAGQLVLCPVDSGRDVLRRWLSAGYDDILVNPTVQRAQAHAGTPLRGREDVRPEAWLGRSPAPGSWVAQAARAATRLPACHDADAWAAELGISQQTLWRRCRASFGATPSRVLSWYVRCQYALGRLRGDTLSRIAMSLGFASPSSLHHSLRRHPPPRWLKGEEKLPPDNATLPPRISRDVRRA